MIMIFAVRDQFCAVARRRYPQKRSIRTSYFIS